MKKERKKKMKRDVKKYVYVININYTNLFKFN